MFFHLLFHFYSKYNKLQRSLMYFQQLWSPLTDLLQTLHILKTRKKKNITIYTNKCFYLEHSPNFSFFNCFFLFPFCYRLNKHNKCVGTTFVFYATLVLKIWYHSINIHHLKNEERKKKRVFFTKRKRVSVPRVKIKIIG